MGEAMKEINEKIYEVARLIVHANRVAVFTGAGVSTESGIPDFRSPGGIWSRFDPEDFTIERFLRSKEVRKKHWQLLLEGGFFDQVEPNPAHLAVANLESLGKLSCVITQNIDSLHQRAGNSPELVLELHGNMRWLNCLSCRGRYSLEEVRAGQREATEAPACEQCGGILKPEVVFFGEALPEHTLKKATELAGIADLFIVIGSSLVVYPAAYLPMYAKEGGAKLVIVNRDETPYDSLADVVISGSAGEIMTRILREVIAISRH